MSRRESLQIYHQLDPEAYLEVLQNEYGALPHSNQPRSFLIGQPVLPFYKPEIGREYNFVLGFNGVPLSYQLLQALIEHPERVPGDTHILWTDEQDLVLETSLEALRGG